MRTPLPGLTVAILIALSLTGCSAADDTGGGSGGDKKVTYKVTTTGGIKKADMTFTDGGTKTTQETGVKVPWTKEVTIADDVLVYQVLAQNASNKKGKITCTIKLGGKVVDENTSSGIGAIATCEHTP